MTALVILVVPGGLMLPLCYMAYAAFSNSVSRRLDTAFDDPSAPPSPLANRLRRYVGRKTMTPGP